MMNLAVQNQQNTTCMINYHIFFASLSPLAQLSNAHLHSSARLNQRKWPTGRIKSYAEPLLLYLELMYHVKLKNFHL
jgi:hypothetical protein